MEYIDKIESLLQKFTYEELNEVDRKLVDEVVGSEEAYNLLRKSTLQAKASSQDLEVNKRMKDKLMDQFKEEWRKSSSSPVSVMIGRKVPAYYALILMLLTAFPFIYLLSQKPQVTEQQITYVDVPGVTDTLYVKLPADTIFTERVVYQKVFIPVESKTDIVLAKKTIQQAEESFATSDVRTSLSENKALNDLMISIE